ncbi:MULTISPECIES: hypothetical protein [Paenibacillus]|uniref:Uncharacterized protein n=1 Tax=Paenibacillus albilobatus TaxID=2716884 RepID=A0A919XLH6_9BACL|nr:MULTISPECIES: hypothetical protein [Paenibacillus]GIO32872.1 hypothetical protein J2TS6_40130 [Paenibacillus albilobatus]
MKNITKWTTVLATMAVLAGGLWYTSSNADAANPQQLKPIGAENQSYNLNPEPKLKANADQKTEILSKKDEISKKFRLHGNNKISSFELKTWDEYNTGNASNGAKELNTSIDDSRLVWVVKVDFADGYDTRVGHFKNAKVTYVIDPETEHVLAQDVQGEQETFEGGPAQFAGKTPVDAD